MTVSWEECLSQWNGLWETAARVEALEHVQRQDAAREPLQLMVGALVCHRKALEGFTDATLHESVPQDPALLKELLSLSGTALLEPAADRRPVVAGIHLASAALRLATAVLETIDARPAAREPFGRLLREEGGRPYDWSRGKCSDHFDDPAIRQHCDGAPLNLATALVLLLLFREDFGHGEEGRGPGTGKRERWIKERSVRMRETQRCRVFQAQRDLIRWGLEELARQ